MTGSLFIAGDWGSSHLRLYLCQYHEAKPLVAIASCTGRGVSQIDGDFEQVFFDLAADWIKAHGPLEVILSGAVGSTLGWKNTPYLDCPVGREQIIASRSVFEARGLRFSILSGVRGVNPAGLPDLMRGEELQLLGWMDNVGQTGSPQIVVLPGTHNKWVLVKNNRIETFVTALTGEIFSLLRQQALLISTPPNSDFVLEGFMRGLEAAKTLKGGQLLHALFTIRSLQVTGDLPESQGESYLSGLLIGSDVQGSLALMEHCLPNIESVTLIGDSRLSYYYQLALADMNIAAEICDAMTCAISGYEIIYQSLFKESSR
jgi:2-dehydro-3-deoxygalactonokinase